MVGALTEFKVAPGFSIQPELFYIQKGAKLVFGLLLRPSNSILSRYLS